MADVISVCQRCGGPIADARGMAIRADAQTPGLAADAELGDEGLVAGLILALDVIEQGAALRHHLQQSTAGMVVLHVGLEMLGEVGDALREDGHLNLGRTCVRGFQRIIRNDRSLAFGSYRHRELLSVERG